MSGRFAPEKQRKSRENRLGEWMEEAEIRRGGGIMHKKLGGCGGIVG